MSTKPKTFTVDQISLVAGILELLSQQHESMTIDQELFNFIIGKADEIKAHVDALNLPRP